jgi:hypothetical protein
MARVESSRADFTNHSGRRCPQGRGVLPLLRHSPPFRLFSAHRAAILSGKQITRAARSVLCHALRIPLQVLLCPATPRAMAGALTEGQRERSFRRVGWRRCLPHKRAVACRESRGMMLRCGAGGRLRRPDADSRNSAVLHAPVLLLLLLSPITATRRRPGRNAAGRLRG